MHLNAHPAAIRGLAVIIMLALVFTGSGVAQTRSPGQDTAGASFSMQRLAQELAPSVPGDSPDGSSARPAVQPIKSTSILVLMMRIAGYLAIVLLVVITIAWLVRRTKLMTRGRPGGGAMDLLEVLPLGQGRNILLVRVSDRVYLLGQTPDEITRIEGFEAEKAVELISASKGGGMIQFKDAFNNFMSKMVRKPS